jgi:hypothetical protein
MAMFLEAPKPTEEQLAKIAQLTATAKASKEAEERSFQNSDTDGFLSQWSHSIGAQRDEANVRILKNGGCAQFSVLCDADGNVVCNKATKFANPHPRGFGWLVTYSYKLHTILADKLGRKWVPAGKKSRIQKQLGLHEETRWFPAYADITVPDGAKSTGLGGAANCYVATFRKEQTND